MTEQVAQAVSAFRVLILSWAERFGGEFWNNLPNEGAPSQEIALTKMNLFFLQVGDDEGQVVLYGATDRKPTYALQNLFRQNISVNWPFTYFLDQAV